MHKDSKAGYLRVVDSGRLCHIDDSVEEAKIRSLTASTPLCNRLFEPSALLCKEAQVVEVITGGHTLALAVRRHEMTGSVQYQGCP